MVDVSANNGAVDFRDLKGCAVIAAKCTEVGPSIEYVDPQYWRNREGARSIGAVFLAYHFGHPAVSAAEQWDFFARHAELHPGDLYALDLEVSDGLPPSEVAAWGSAWAHAGYGATHAWPWVYSDQSFILNGNFAGVRNCPLWVAILGSPGTGNVQRFDGMKVIARQWSQRGTDRDLVYVDAFADLAFYAIPTPRAYQASRLMRDLREARTELGVAERLLRKFGGLRRG